MSLFRTISTPEAALERIAAALEEANRLQRRFLGMPDPESEALEEDLASVSIATDADSYEYEIEDQRNRPR